MSAQPQSNEIHQEVERELVRRLNRAEAEHKPAEVEIAGNRYHLVPVDDDIQTTNDPARNYDPQKALAAVEAGFGAFKTMDVEAFLAEILEEREQDTPGHSF
ncbi:MAG: hypothetical protein M3Y58_06450 [Chloroflexota bacterium]|nr:hypothetical protein [Chloroflexota bacterium]